MFGPSRKGELGRSVGAAPIHYFDTDSADFLPAPHKAASTSVDCA